MSEMRIIVLVKQVPDPNLVTISKEGYLLRENVPSMTDPFGMMALQHALRLKKEIGAHVTAVSMGPAQAEDMLRRCLEYGVDEAILLSDKAFAGADTLATARTLGCFLKSRRYDFVFCGMQATDGDTGQLPPELSAVLGIQIYSYVSKVVIDDPLRMTQIYEDRSLEIEAHGPAVVSFLRPPEDGIVLPSMVDFVDAKGKEVTVLSAWMVGVPPGSMGSNGSKTHVIKTQTVKKIQKETEFIDGSDTRSAALALISEVKG